jgi:hypothetical protein
MKEIQERKHLVIKLHKDPSQGVRCGELWETFEIVFQLVNSTNNNAKISSLPPDLQVKFSGFKSLKDRPLLAMAIGSKLLLEAAIPIYSSHEFEIRESLKSICEIIKSLN